MEMLYIDKTELIYTDITKSQPPTYNIPYSQISTIFYGVTTRKSFFGLIKKQVRYIGIKSNNLSDMLMIYENDVGEDTYEKYLEGIKEFAVKNRLTLRESTGETKDDWRL